MHNLKTFRSGKEVQLDADEAKVAHERAESAMRDARAPGGALMVTGAIAGNLLMGSLAVVTSMLDGKPVRLLCEYSGHEFKALAVLLDNGAIEAERIALGASKEASTAPIVIAIPPLPFSSLVGAINDGHYINDVGGCGDPTCTNCGGDGSLLPKIGDDEAEVVPAGAVMH